MKNNKHQFFKPEPEPKYKPKLVLDLQLDAMVENKYWTVLNTHLLAEVIGKKPQGHMKTLAEKANTVKHELQTYGPILRGHSADFRANKGKKVSGEIFHSDMKAGTTTYVMEWTVLNEDKRMIALLGFDTHENYDYQQKLLTAKQQSKILSDPRNLAILERVELKMAEAKYKAEGVALNMSM
jgi:hypothetical protein